MNQPLQAPRKGFLFIFEGIDGSGKSTQAKRLQAYLQHQGLPVLCLREPTDGPWGKQALDLVTRGRGTVTPQQELELFMQDRRDNVARNLEPNLRAKKIIVQDRYYYSTTAYQGALGLDYQKILRDNRAIAPAPDAAFYLDIDEDEALRRIKLYRKQAPDQFEKKEYLKNVRDIYLKIEDPALMRIDGCKTPDQIFALIQARVDSLLAAPHA